MSDLSFGQPQLSDYYPQITVRDLKSPNSRTKRIKGYKTNRIHHLLSDFESKYFYMLEWADDVTDIREQFPMNLQKTMEIAKHLGIKHPAYNDEQIVMTTDFVISTNKQKVIARTLKHMNELENLRVLEKFCIEYEYWKANGVDWGIVTENEINEIYVRNIMHFIRSRNYIRDIGIDSFIIQQIVEAISVSNSNLADVLMESDFRFGLENGQSLAIFNSLVGNKILKVNMFNKFSLSVSCSEIKIIGAI